MAKKDNKIDVAGGLSFGNSQNVEQDAPAVKQEQAPVVKEPAPEVKEVAPEHVKATEEQAEPAAVSSKSLAEIYESKMQGAVESRTVRLQVVVTPTTGNKLDDLVAQRKIKSKNDLINFLLEGYLKTID